MSDKKWTPGPWEWVQLDKYLGLCDNKENIVLCFGPPSMPPSDVDAELIASAPDMAAEIEQLKCEVEKAHKTIIRLKAHINWDCLFDEFYCYEFSNCRDCIRTKMLDDKLWDENGNYIKQWKTISTETEVNNE